MNIGVELATRLMRRPIGTRWTAGRPTFRLVAGTVGTLIGPLAVGLLANRRAGDLQKRLALRASAIGAAAVGALAIGAMSIGVMAIARLSVRSMRIARLRIDHLEVRQASGTWMPATQLS